MGLSDDAFFMIKHTPLANGNHPISSPICPMGVADTLEQDSLLLATLRYMIKTHALKKLESLVYKFSKGETSNPLSLGWSAFGKYISWLS